MWILGLLREQSGLNFQIVDENIVLLFRCLVGATLTKLRSTEESTYSGIYNCSKSLVFSWRPKQFFRGEK